MFTSFIMREKEDVKRESEFEDMARKLHGINTISTIRKKLRIAEKTAINYVYELRRSGFVKTIRGRGKIRTYFISPTRRKELGYPGLYDTINAHSPIKIAEPFEHRVYKEMSIEEAIVRALETMDFRTILASLALFRYVENWSRLYKYAKEKDVRRQAGAIYEISRKTMRVRRMDKRIENRLLAAKQKNRFIVPGIIAKDFLEISKRWNVHIPFTKGDLRRFKEWRA